MLIDTNKQPFIPDGITLESHKGLGKIDPTKIELYLSEKQKTGYIKGTDLLKELEDKPVLNAVVLDYLLKHPKLIPDEWKDKYVYFWGTIYSNSYGNLFVRCLDWNGRRWGRLYSWLDNDWLGCYPAALSK